MAQETARNMRLIAVHIQTEGKLKGETILFDCRYELVPCSVNRLMIPRLRKKPYPPAGAGNAFWSPDTSPLDTQTDANSFAVHNVGLIIGNNASGKTLLINQLVRMIGQLHDADTLLHDDNDFVGISFWEVPKSQLVNQGSAVELVWFDSALPSPVQPPDDCGIRRAEASGYRTRLPAVITLSNAFERRLSGLVNQDWLQECSAYSYLKKARSVDDFFEENGEKALNLLSVPVKVKIEPTEVRLRITTNLGANPVQKRLRKKWNDYCCDFGLDLALMDTSFQPDTITDFFLRARFLGILDEDPQRLPSVSAVGKQAQEERNRFLLLHRLSCTLFYDCVPSKEARDQEIASMLSLGAYADEVKLVNQLLCDPGLLSSNQSRGLFPGRIVVEDQRKDQQLLIRFLKDEPGAEGHYCANILAVYQSLHSILEQTPALDWRVELSNGELHKVELIMNIVNSIQTLREIYPFNPILVLVDEVDLSLHPEWQREVFSELLHLFATPDLFINPDSIHLLVTTHSPILLSDFPASNIVCLRLDESGTHTSVNSHAETFAQNIYELYQDAMFLTSAIGEFAQQKLTGLLHDLKDTEQTLDKQSQPLTNEDYAAWEAHLDTLTRYCNAFGDKILKTLLHNRLTRCRSLLNKLSPPKPPEPPQAPQSPEELAAKIKALEEQLAKLNAQRTGAAKDTE